MTRYAYTLTDDLEATDVDRLLFGAKRCAGPCGRLLARCADFFEHDADEIDGLTRWCRRCRRDMHERQKASRQAPAQEERLFEVAV